MAALMNRVNFANCSHVIVDVCRQHGTWFDKDELRRIVEFIRAGGLDQARADKLAELQRQQQELKAAQMAGPSSLPDFGESSYSERHAGLASAAADLITSFFFD